jgi:hypothetical protein
MRCSGSQKGLRTASGSHFVEEHDPAARAGHRSVKVASAPESGISPCLGGRKRTQPKPRDVRSVVAYCSLSCGRMKRRSIAGSADVRRYIASGRRCVEPQWHRFMHHNLMSALPAGRTRWRTAKSDVPVVDRATGQHHRRTLWQKPDPSAPGPPRTRLRPHRSAALRTVWRSQAASKSVRRTALSSIGHGRLDPCASSGISGIC